MGNQLRVTPVQTLAFGSIGASYTQVGVASMFAGIAILIQNFTDADIMFSFTGHTDHFPVSANTSFIFDIMSDKTLNNDIYLSAGTGYFVKELTTPPSSGAVYVTVILPKLGGPVSQITRLKTGGIIPPGTVVETLTGNSGGAVGPNGASNINVIGDGTTIDVVGNPGTNTLTISSISNNASESFSAHLTATQSNATGDGTIYNIPYNAVYFDNGGNFNTGTHVFVAPATGDYFSQ